MKAVIILVLVGSVLAVPPVRVITPSQSASQDAHAHVFAEVRPAGQKHQQQHLLGMDLNEQTLVVQAKPAHQAASENHAFEVELKPAHQSPLESHVVEVGIKPAEQKPQHIELDIKPVHQSPSHVVEVEIKQADQHQKPQHFDVELQGKQTHHEVELEVIHQHQQQPPHQIEVEIVQGGASSEVKQTLPLHSVQHLNLNLVQ